MTNFSTPHQRFTFVQLLYPYLINSWSIFSKSLSTMALYHSTIWWFNALSCKTTPVVQLTTVSTIFITACRTCLLPWFCFSAHYVLLGNHGALHYHGTQNLNSSNAFEISTSTPIKYMRCYAPKFISFPF